MLTRIDHPGPGPWWWNGTSLAVSLFASSEAMRGGGVLILVAWLFWVLDSPRRNRPE